jgi:poly-gamma-glutamate synthesis protein (capsule biosynthesis protein)
MAWPHECDLDVDEVIHSLDRVPVVANLEGSILSGYAPESRVWNDQKFNLYSDQSILVLARALGIKAFGVANNHSGDYQEGLGTTEYILENEGINVFGTRAKQMAIVECGSTAFRIFGACSPLTDPNRRAKNDTVAIFDPYALLRQIQDDRSKYPSSKIVVFIHWGYELAAFPLPADRQWARKVIEAGADYVIGHHPHIVQGVERYRDGLIAYSVGNFLLPQTYYRNRRLRYDDNSVELQVGLSVGEKEELYWYRYDVSGHKVRFLERTLVDEDCRIRSMTPYYGMEDTEYAEWYRANLNSGVIRTRIGQPIIWSYFGVGRATYRVKSRLFDARQGLRKLAIVAGLHRPDNW